jgi:CRP-like cAMP-binding protein
MPATVRLLEVEPELGRRLSADEREVARRLMIPLVQLDASSPELDQVLEEKDAFAALLLDGMVMHRMSIGGRRILRLLGPGDIIVHTWAPRSEILGSSSKRAAGHARIALLGRPLADAARQCPGLIVALHMHLGDQHQRLAVQLGICQLPRVQERVLTLMWLLAETWGRVTPEGTRLPVKLTHSAIGELIGARRSTVSLALRDLVEQGALSAQEHGWMLLAGPPAVDNSDPPAGDPHIVEAVDPVFSRNGSARESPNIATDDNGPLVARPT